MLAAAEALTGRPEAATLVTGRLHFLETCELRGVTRVDVDDLPPERRAAPGIDDV
jgi:hypothetical protein